MSSSYDPTKYIEGGEMRSSYSNENGEEVGTYSPSVEQEYQKKKKCLTITAVIYIVIYILNFISLYMAWFSHYYSFSLLSKVLYTLESLFGLAIVSSAFYFRNSTDFRIFLLLRNLVIVGFIGDCGFTISSAFWEEGPAWWFNVIYYGLMTIVFWGVLLLIFQPFQKFLETNKASLNAKKTSM